MQASVKPMYDSDGRYCGLSIDCHAGHHHFVPTDWTPPGKVRNPHYGPEHCWKFNGNLDKPSLIPSVKVCSGHYERNRANPDHCYCNFRDRYPNHAPMSDSPDARCYVCHFVLTNGVMQYGPDCTHMFKGKNMAVTDDSSSVRDIDFHNVKARFIRKIRTESYWRVYWWDRAHPCKDGDAFHQAFEWIDWGPVDDREFANHRDTHVPKWPTHCDKCGLKVPCTFEDRMKYSQNDGTGAGFQIWYEDTYNTASGKPEPGDIFYDDACQRLKDEDDEPGHCHQTRKPWTNCNGRHLIGVLPNGRHWDIDSRCNNCGLPDDTVHRCWVRHGDPEKGELVHVDKKGLTCNAGGGSILIPQWHGFLRSGVWVK